jgi:DNA ligase (NAD+)
MNIEGLGSETVAGLVEKGKIQTSADLYDLTYGDLLGLEFTVSDEFGENPKKRSLQEKSVRNLLAGIEASKAVPFERVLFALGIRHVGETVAKKIARAKGSIHQLAASTTDELISIDEVGEKIAQSIVNWFTDPRNQQLVERLRVSGLQFESQYTAPQAISAVFAGKTFVVSGVFQHFSRDGIKAFIEQHGGKVSGSISAKTSYLVAGDDMGPAKRQKAESLGVPILVEQDFLRMSES